MEFEFNNWNYAVEASCDAGGFDIAVDVDVLIFQTTGFFFNLLWNVYSVQNE